MARDRRKEKTVWCDEKWRVTLRYRTNNPGQKAIAYFKNIQVASYDDRGLRDHQDGIAMRRIPIRGDVESIMRIAYENANLSPNPRVYA